MATLSWRTILIAIFLAILPGARSAEYPWRFSNPSPHGNNIAAMLVTSNNVWQAGDRGSVYTSPDLDHWFPRESGTTQSLRGITIFGDSVFISGAEGTIVSGKSPWSLQARSLNTPDWLEGIAASPARIVAVGDNGAIYNSGDGLSWSRVNKFDTWLRSVAYGLGNFVAVGENGFLALSPDGVTWTQRTLNTSANLNHVSFSQGTFWIVGDSGTVVTNNSRLSFIPFVLDITNNLYSVAVSTNEVVLVGDSTVLMRSSSDLIWKEQTDASSFSFAPIWPYYSAAWDGRLFLLGGRNGMKVEGFRTNSIDPIIWYSTVQPTRNWLWSATRQEPIYAAVGESGTIVTSADGIDWSREVVPTNAIPEILLGTGGTTNCLVAVGTSGTILYSQNTFTNLILTNTSGELETNSVPLFGVNWQAANLSITNTLQGIAGSLTKGYLVTGSKGMILTSPDAISWRQRSSPVTTFLSSAAEYPSGWIVCGDFGTILTSSDGDRWTVRNSGVTNWIYSVRYANSTFVAVGEAGLILTSPDGVTWSRRNSGLSQWLNDVAFVNNQWFIAANAGMILTSTDAVNWKPQSSITSRSLNALAISENQIVAAGADGMILRKDLVASGAPANFLSFSQNLYLGTFLFEGQTDGQFWLEQADEITGPWSTVTALELLDSSGTLLLQRDMDAAPKRFFRTRLKPPSGN
jgi:hypothetical protein